MEPGARLKNKDRGGFPNIGILPCLCVYLYFSYRIISFMDGIENLSCGYTIPGFYVFVVPGNFHIYGIIRPKAHGKDHSI